MYFEFMMFDKIIAERRSIRKYKDNPVTQEQITAILDAGNKAPSAKNKQHWRFHVFTKKAKDDFTSFCLMEFDKIAKEPGVEQYTRYSFQIMEEAPVVVLVFISDIMEHPLRPDIQSVSAAIQNMLLKSQQLG
jgi:nitroreductase